MGNLKLPAKLTILNALPDGILDHKAEDLYQILEGPTLIHLNGALEPAIFVSVLLHGNEHTSWEALRYLLKEFSGRELPRSISLFIGNVEAAKYNARHLDGNVDFNRIWGSENQEPRPLMQEVLTQMRERGVFLSIDIHNNTGKNPHYACVNNLNPEFLYLASLFSHNVVYFLKPEGVQSMAFSKLCPAVTVECGLSGDSSGTLHALEFLLAGLTISHFPSNALSNSKLRIFHTVAIVKINPAYEFTFNQNLNDDNCQIVLDQKLESTNFSELNPGTLLGRVSDAIEKPLLILAEDGRDVSDDYIDVKNNTLTLKRKVIPSMFTLNKDVIKKDCLCYFMEHYPL